MVARSHSYHMRSEFPIIFMFDFAVVSYALHEKVEPRGYFVQDLVTDLRDGEVLHVLLMSLFGPGTPAHSDAKLPPLPQPPKGGGALSGSGAAALRQSAVKQQLLWLHKAFGAAAGLDVCLPLLSSSSPSSQAPSPPPTAASSSSSSDLGALELEESDAEDALPDFDSAVPGSSAARDTKVASPTAAAAAAATDQMLDSLALAISSGSDPAATLGVVWACAQCWCAHGCLASRAPSYAACLAPQLLPSTSSGPSAALTNTPLQGASGNGGVPASGTHDGLKEWLLAYFAALASIGARVPLPPPPPPAAAVPSPQAAASSKSTSSARLQDVDIQSGKPADSSSGGGGGDSSGIGATEPFSSGANCPGKHGLSTFKTTNNSWWCRCVCA